jgi:hypothetical protein
MADRVEVKGDVFLGRGHKKRFLAEGEVRLAGAQIGGNLDCNGGTFKNRGVNGSGIALSLDHAKVGAQVSLGNVPRAADVLDESESFYAEGEVELTAAQIANLDCQGGRIEKLTAQGAIIKGNLFIDKVKEPKFLTIDLTNASVGCLIDDEDSWPSNGNLLLDGLTYQRIAGAQLDARTRLRWLRRQPSFAPQPYRQLAKILKDNRDDRGWRKVCVEMERKARRKRAGIAWLMSPILRGTIGYGYFSWRAVCWLLTLVVIGLAIYHKAYLVGSVVPSEKEAYSFFEAHGEPPTHYVRFYALPYSLENSFPLVKLGVQDKWIPAPAATNAHCQPIDWISALVCPRAVRVFRWVQICLGWVLTTLFVGGVTGTFVRND